VNIDTWSGLANTQPIGAYMRLDTAGQVLSASMVAETYQPNAWVGPFVVGSNHLIRSGKSFYFISPGSSSINVQPYIKTETKLVRLDSNYQVSWVQGRPGAEGFFYNAPAPKSGLAIAGNEFGSPLSPNNFGTMFCVKLIDSAGGNPNASCYFWGQEH